MSALIAYFSRADENYFSGALRTIPVGNTEVVAGLLEELTQADCFKIEPMQPYSADYNACIAEAQDDQRRDARPELREYPDSLDEYDTIYLGYPNYWGTMPMAVYTFLENYNFTGKRIHPFCTHEGSGLSGTTKDIQKAAPGAAVTEGIAIHGSHVDGAKGAIAEWVKEFRK